EKCDLLKARVIIYAYNHHVRLLPPEPLVVNQPKSTRVKESALLCNHVDPTRPTRGWRTAWRNALKQAGFHCRFHDLRHTAITKLAEGQASDMTIMGIAGHVSKKMLERYSHIRMTAKRAALDAIAQGPDLAVSGVSVHQNVHQLQDDVLDDSSKPLN
ncbi:MAG TPA: tyrosine-type recombinase/integrase, partial [Candidatus Acidoferrum sp.]|nr:tyrosine-type recombinase/integrase [Candidatus Acidoferrum sp.]